MTTMTVTTVEDIRPGDQFVADGSTHWTAIGWPTTGPDPTALPDEHRAPDTVVTLLVRFRDGGDGYRAWSPGQVITIERPDSTEEVIAG